jgi:feruloyl esterase
MFYGAKAAHTYFVGCSDGGREGLMEGQRYPEDFNGILAGAPAINLAALAAIAVHEAQMAAALGPNQLSEAQVRLLAARALQHCDVTDGVKDGVIRNPRSCRFNVQELACHGSPSDECLTQPQVAAVQALYSDFRDAKTGELLAYGYSGTLGTEIPVLGPNGGRLAIGQSVLTNMVYEDPKLDLLSVDVAKAYHDVQNKIDPIADPLSTDLSAMRDTRRKIIQYHGWADPLIPVQYSLAYFDAVQKSLGDTRDFYRLFLAPGMGHCGGGIGPTWVTGAGVIHDAQHDAIIALTRWVETGVSPDQIIATEFGAPVTDPINGPPAGTPIKSTRPLCPYPQLAVYKGLGSIAEAKNFKCKAG